MNGVGDASRPRTQAMKALREAPARKVYGSFGPDPTLALRKSRNFANKSERAGAENNLVRAGSSRTRLNGQRAHLK